MDSFESYRPLLFSIAYRMLGSAMEAEDMVQEAYLRYQAVPPEQVKSPKALLCTIITRLCINQLQSARAQRETYVGPWLPEPILTGEGAAFSPAAQMNVDESISMAFLVLLESLNPPERAVFLLREVFDYPYEEIAQIVGKEEATCRQLFSRAKKHLSEGRPRFKPSPEIHRQMLTRFMNAVGEGDLDGLTQMLSSNVAMWADGGGKARGAAIYPLYGRDVVTQFLVASTRLPEESYRAEFAAVNGEPAVILRIRERAIVVFMIVTDGRTIHEIRVIGNPDKLKHL